MSETPAQDLYVPLKQRDGALFVMVFQSKKNMQERDGSFCKVNYISKNLSLSSVILQHIVPKGCVVKTLSTRGKPITGWSRKMTTCVCCMGDSSHWTDLWGPSRAGHLMMLSLPRLFLAHGSDVLWTWSARAYVGTDIGMDLGWLCSPHHGWWWPLCPGRPRDQPAALCRSQGTSLKGESWHQQ